MRSAQGRLRDGPDLTLDRPFDWRRGDFALPDIPEPFPADSGPQARQRWERATLHWLRRAEPAAAHELRDLSLGLAQAQAELAQRVFWKISAAFFEMLEQARADDSPANETACKRALAAILRQGATGAPEPSAELAQSLLAYCLTAVPIDTAAVPLWNGVCQAYAEAPTRVSEVWLGAADEASRQLEAALASWIVTPQLPLPRNAVPWAWTLAVRAGDVGLAVLAEFAEALALALQAALRGVDAEQAQLLAQAAEHLRHLLHQHAAGFEKTPQPALLQGLRELSRTTA